MITMVYIEFSYGLMRTVVLDKNREKYYVRACYDVVLHSAAYVNGVIYNLSSITASFQEIVRTYALENLSVVLSVEKENVLNILQIILSFAKSGLKLYKVMGRALINWEKNMKYARLLVIDGLYHQSMYFKDLLLSMQELKRWWYPSASMIILLVMVAIGGPSEKMKFLTHKEHHAARRNEEVKDALHAYEMVRDTYKHIDKHMHTPPTLLPSKNPSVSLIMRSLSLIIRQKTWVTGISMKKEPQSDATHLHVEGKTLLQKEVTYFKQDFERLVLYSKITLNVLKVEGHGVSTFACSGVLHKS